MAALLVAWFVWLPNYRPHLRPGERYGIDVSSHQGSIDWARVAGDDISFVYIKATEGADFVDRSFGRNWAGAGEVHLDRGAYHFFTLCASGEEQAQNFLGTLPEVSGELPPAVDLELAGNCAARPTPGEVERELAAFLELVEARTGMRALLYIAEAFDDRYQVRSRFDRSRWVRRFLLRPRGDWAVWQVGSFANVDGISGRVDLDVMR